MEIQILKLDTPNANNKIYPTEVVAEAVEKLEGQALLGTVGLPASSTLKVDEVSFAVSNLRISDGVLLGTLTPLETRAGKALKSLVLDPNMAFRPCGHADVAEDGTVSNFSFSSIAAIPSDIAA